MMPGVLGTEHTGGSWYEMKLKEYGKPCRAMLGFPVLIPNRKQLEEERLYFGS